MMDDAEAAAAMRVLEHRQFYRHWGNEVTRFEAAFADLIGLPFAIAMNSGTSAVACVAA